MNNAPATIARTCTICQAPALHHYAWDTNRADVYVYRATCCGFAETFTV